MSAPAQSPPTGADVVQSLPWRWNTQGLVFLVGGLGFMFDAWDVSLNGVLIPLLSEEWGLERSQAALIGTANLIGMAVGSIVWGTIADRVGRRRAFAWTLAVFSVFTVAGALTSGLGWFLVFRFLAGFGLGGCIPVDYALVAEFTPRRHRGRVLSAMDGWWPIGAALAGFVSAGLVAAWNDWRPPLIVMVLPALLIFAVRLAMPESPMFLASRGREAEARAVIDGLVKRTGATPVDYRIEPPAEAASGGLGALTGQLGEVWSYSWRITASSWALFAAILTTYFVALQWLPTFLIGAGYARESAFIQSAGMAAVGVIGVVVSTALIEATGRRWLLAVSAPAACLLLVALGFAIDLPAVGLTLVLGFGLVVQVAIPVLYTYVSELYPTRLRGSGFGWASTVSRVGAGIGPLVFVGWLEPNLGLPGAFTVCLAAVLAAVAAMFALSPETRGRALD